MASALSISEAEPSFLYNNTSGSDEETTRIHDLASMRPQPHAAVINYRKGGAENGAAGHQGGFPVYQRQTAAVHAINDLGVWTVMDDCG